MSKLPSFRVKATRTQYSHKATPSHGNAETADPQLERPSVGERLRAVTPNLGLTEKDLDEGTDYFQAEAEKARLSIRLKELLGGAK